MLVERAKIIFLYRQFLFSTILLLALSIPLNLQATDGGGGSSSSESCDNPDDDTETDPLACQPIEGSNSSDGSIPTTTIAKPTNCSCKCTCERPTYGSFPNGGISCVPEPIKPRPGSIKDNERYSWDGVVTKDGKCRAPYWPANSCSGYDIFDKKSSGKLKNCDWR